MVLSGRLYISVTPSCSFACVPLNHYIYLSVSSYARRMGGFGVAHLYTVMSCFQVSTSVCSYVGKGHCMARLVLALFSQAVFGSDVWRFWPPTPFICGVKLMSSGFCTLCNLDT